MNDTRLVLFDLDGTLIDTAPDMAGALNELLAAEGRATLPFESIRPHVSHGASGLLTLAFGDGLAASELARLRTDFLARYQARLAHDSRPFPGIDELLARIEGAGMDWGVVTNKPAWLTDPLLERLDLARRAQTVVSGDTLEQRKPDPAPLLFACSESRVAPPHAVYVGDAERDIVAGRAAGMATYIALYGYLDAVDRPDTWYATARIAYPTDLWPHLQRPTADIGVP